MAIDLFCSLLFNLSITEILMCKVNAHFPGCFMPIILANRFQFNGENYWHETSRNTLHNCILVMNKIKINK